MSLETSAESLLPFDAFMLDDRHRDLSRQAFEWSLKCSHSPDRGEHAHRAFLAAMFGSFCAPRSSNLDDVLISVKFLVLFWQIDEASALEVQGFIRRLQGDGELTGTAEGEFDQYYESLMATLLRVGHDVAGFRKSLMDLCVAVLHEKKSDKEDWTEEEMLGVRKVICGIPAFAECWRSIRGIGFSSEVALATKNVLDITCELASLVNDIASFDRDEKTMQIDRQEADANLVLLRMRSLGTREAALESGIQWYNRKVEEFHLAEQALLTGEHGHDPALRSYLEILHCAIVGDLATSKHLVPMRYEGSAPALARLVKLDDLSR